MAEKYEFVKDIGSGSFGVAKLMRNKETRELVVIKFIERGDKINKNVAREMVNHRSLRHPNIVQFKEVLLTPTHLGIVMEYAAGGELSQYVSGAPRGRLSEDEARYFFQQLISGISYCHSMQVSHGDLKLENTLLDGSPAAGLKICDLGFSVSSLLHSRRQSAAGTPVYMAPEVLVNGECDGKLADVWSCGVILYVMLVGAYPFDDNEEPKSFQKIVQQILGVEYKIPNYIEISSDCRQMLSRIFVAEPTKRITIKEIKNHPWFLKNLPQELTVAYQARYHSRNLRSLQSLEEMMIIVSEAKKPKLDTLSVSRDTGVAKPEKDVDPTMSRLRLPEKSIVLPNQLQSRYLNPSTSQMRWAATTSIDPLDSQYSTQAAPAYYPTISDVRLAERSIVDPDGLHSWNLDPSASQLKTAESSIVDSENLDSLYSAQTKTLYDVSMSDVHPAERSADLYY